MEDAKRQSEELEIVLAAIAHESRRQILLTVWFRGGAMGAGDIAKRFHCAWPTISRHIKILEDAGLLTHQKEGRNRTYMLNREKLKVVHEWLTWFDTPAEKL